MYQIDNAKRYNVIVKLSNGHSIGKFQNVSLITVTANFLAFQDKDGKEHIYTGPMCIEISEV